MTATTGRKNLTLGVLSVYYAEVHNLQAYLYKIIKEESYRKACDDTQSDFLLQAPDSLQYRELLNCSFVCLLKEATTECSQFSAFEHYARMKDVSAYVLDIRQDLACDSLWRLFRRPMNVYSHQNPSQTIL